MQTVVVGAINWDINLFVQAFPTKGEEVVVKRITHVPGGKGGNAAVAAARILGPNKAAVFGGLGKDWIATEHIRIFQSEGVDITGIKMNADVESGQAFIVIDQNGDNIIHTHFGANATLDPEDLDDPTRQKILADVKIVTIIDPPFDTALKLARESKRLRKIIAWDPGVKSEFGLHKAGPLLENVDYVVANESEMKNLTGTYDDKDGAARLIEMNGHVKVIAKLGSKGSALYWEQKRVMVPALDLESRGLKVVNTVGCGDAFLGAFVAALAEGRSDSEALSWGNCAGSLKATKAETRGGPDRETLLGYVG